MQLELTENELESFEILIEVLDFNAFSSNKLIGSYSIGNIMNLNNLIKKNFQVSLPYI